MATFIFGEFEEEKVECPSCKWISLGKDLKPIEFHESLIFDLGCPKCMEYVGFMSCPTTEQYEAFTARNKK
jgi:hypothetical protein